MGLPPPMFIRQEPYVCIAPCADAIDQRLDELSLNFVTNPVNAGTDDFHRDGRTGLRCCLSVQNSLKPFNSRATSSCIRVLPDKPNVLVVLLYAADSVRV